MKSIRHLILVSVCVLGLSNFGCQSSMRKNAVSPPMQHPNSSNVTVSYFNYADNTKSQDYENGDLIYLRDYDAWQQEVYGPLIALGPFLVDNPE